MQSSKRAYSWLQYFLQVLFTACIYFMLARVSLLLQFESSNATPVWPPSGFAFAMVLLWGTRIAPGIFFGAFAANFLIFVTNQTVDYPAAATLSLIIGAGNTLEALSGNYLLKKFIPNFNIYIFLDKVEHILRYSLAAALMCIIGATIGTLTVYCADIITQTMAPQVWLTWWLGDFSGVLLITSFLLIWLKSFKVNESLVSDLRSLRTETIIFFLVVIFTGVIIFDNWLLSNSIFRWAYWIIPVLVWAAMRFSQRELITALVMYSLIAIWGTVHHRGPFSTLTLNESLLAVQSFITIMVITKLTLHVSVLERKETEAVLRKTGEELELRVKQRTSQLQERNQFVESILNSSFDSIIVLDRELRCISINKIAKNQLRLPYPENVIGKKVTEIPSFLIPFGVIEDIHAALDGETIHREKFASPISEVYFEIDYIPLKNETGVYAVMIVGHDITQSIHAAEEIREQKIFAEMLIENSP
ncbi:MAG TPA: MASE1 domain-containing protein, partial [Flavitalea sp.]|nr:MASE1 domain-containing protein [Flavitalea sp.]